MITYHDTEWGVPVHDDKKWFEHIVLDGAQAGLSWLTILKKREAFREVVGRYTWEKVLAEGYLPLYGDERRWNATSH